MHTEDRGKKLLSPLVK